MIGRNKYLDKEVLTVSQRRHWSAASLWRINLSITNSKTGGETIREVVKRPGIETSKGANRPGSESSNVVSKRPGGELAK